MFSLLPQTIIGYLFVNSDHRERDLDILECRLKGSVTMQALAKRHGISRSRVMQIECEGRRGIAWHLNKWEEAWKKQGELLATIKTLETEAAAYRKIKETITPYLFPGDKPLMRIIAVEDLKRPEMISVRLYWALRNAGIETLNEVAALLQKGDDQILRLPNFGRVSLVELKKLLVKYGLT